MTGKKKFLLLAMAVAAVGTYMYLILITLIGVLRLWLASRRFQKTLV